MNNTEVKVLTILSVTDMALTLAVRYFTTARPFEWTPLPNDALLTKFRRVH